MNIQNICAIPIQANSQNCKNTYYNEEIDIIPRKKYNECVYVDLNECSDVKKAIETSKGPVILVEDKPSIYKRNKPVFLFNTTNGIAAVAVSGLEDALLASGHPVDDMAQLVEKGLVKLPKEHKFKKPSTLIQY